VVVAHLSTKHMLNVYLRVTKRMEGGMMALAEMKEERNSKKKIVGRVLKGSRGLWQNLHIVFQFLQFS
jgi:hypothetical protein